jgi:uncharacterized protein YggE
MFRIALVSGVTLIAAAFAAQLPCSAVERSISVSGTGTVDAPPDEVTIELLLKAVDHDLVRVRNTSDLQVRKALEFAQAHGAKEGDYRVSGLKLGLSYNEQLRRQIFHVEREMSLRLVQLENLNPLLAELLKQSDWSVESITFGSTRSQAIEADARRLAMEDARASAAQAAELADLKLGKPISISIDLESQAPFVTSVIPVVGRGDDPFGAKSDARPRVEDGKDGPQVAAVQSSAQLLAVALSGQDDGVDDEDDNAAFGLGKIRFSARVSVEYELTD